MRTYIIIYLIKQTTNTIHARNFSVWENKMHRNKDIILKNINDTLFAVLVFGFGFQGMYVKKTNIFMSNTCTGYYHVL